MGDINVSEHLRILGTEAERLRDAIEAALRCNSPANMPVYQALPVATRIIVKRIVNDVTALADVFNGPIGAQAGRSDGDVAAVYRATGRLEQVLDHLIDTWRAARDIPAEPGETYPHQLLVDGVRNLLDQVSDILDRMASIVAHPEAFDTGGEGTVRATLSAKLRNPPEFQELADWWHLHGHVIEAQERRGGFWSAVGAVALGTLLGGSLFDECN